MGATGKVSSKVSISRRNFIAGTVSAAAGLGLVGQPGCGKKEETTAEPENSPLINPSGYGWGRWNEIFETIARGFVRNALRTSDTFAVCDYRGGTILKNFISARGRTCDSVSRIMPALAARIASPDGAKTLEVDGKTYDLAEVFTSALRHGTDPQVKDFWQYASPTDWDQRQVESSIIAWSLWLARDVVLERLSQAERQNVQKWLASCTLVEVRRNNWALFTAVNHAVRLALSDKWPEFSGDEDFFRADLAAIDGMYAGDGWYSDTTQGSQYDYYNFWVFASHNLYWDIAAGDRFPALRDRFRERLAKFLAGAPLLFGANGSHVLWGRSLIYRWAVLTPLVLSWRAGLWPHSAGLLRRICNANLAFLWEAGAWDSENDRLLETLTPHSSRSVRESYINNGHPYWGMQAFAALALPQTDPFWSAPEEPLPVEKGDFSELIAGPGILVAGHRESGQVQAWQTACDKSADYRSKYYNFSYSTHFPFNVETVDDRVPPDCTLSFRDSQGNYARRDTPFTGQVMGTDRMRWSWKTLVGKTEVSVESLALIEGEMQWRVHRLRFEGPQPIVAAESTYALGLGPEDQPEVTSGGVWVRAANPASGHAVFIRAVLGFNTAEGAGGFQGREDLNVFHARAVQASVSVNLEPGREHILIAAVYASPRPLPLERLLD
ncbi:MAG: DUF2264 domain-containing protein, partial [Candidatus Glassbacteria bacterium]